MQKKTVHDFWDGQVKNIYGVDTAKKEEGSNAFYAEAEHIRYDVDHTYLKKLVRFERFKNRKVLEIGVGMGLDAKEFAKSGAIYTGIDLTPSAIRNTKKLFDMYKLKGTLQVGDAEKLVFKDGTFDLVYSCGVLHHTPKTRQAIDEVYRVLKPGGYAIIMLYHKNSFHYYIDIFLYRYLLRLGFLKMRLSKVLNENTDGGGNPLSKVYSKKDIHKLFRRFKKIRTQPQFLTLPGIIEKILPEKTKSWLANKIGWNLFIFAKKPLLKNN